MKNRIALKIALTSAGLLTLAFPALSSADAVSDLQAQIQNLLAQIAVLQQQTPTPSPVPVTDDSGNRGSGFCPDLSITIQRGSTDAATNGQVSELQRFIADYYDVAEEDIVTGFFGRVTQGYVIQFQTEQGLPTAGIVGSLTRAAIARVCSSSPTPTPTPPAPPPLPLPPSPPSNATFSVSTDPSSPGYGIVAGGSTGVTLAVFKFHATGEAINLSKVGLTLASGKSTDLGQVYLYSPTGTLLGTANFTGTNTGAISTLSTGMIIPQNGDATIIVKGDIASIGTGRPGTSGDLIQVIVSPGTGGTGASSGIIIGPSSLNTPVAGVRIFRSYPTVAKINLANTPLINGSNTLLRFSITATPGGSISIGKLAAAFAATNASLSTMTICAYSDASFSQQISQPTACSTSGTFPVPSGGGFDNVYASPLVIPAGQTYYFEVRGMLSGLSGVSSVVTSLPRELGLRGPDTFSAVYNGNGNLIWSPNTLTTSAKTDSDWFNGYDVLGNTISQSLVGVSTSGPTASLTASVTPASVRNGIDTTVIKWDVSNYPTGASIEIGISGTALNVTGDATFPYRNIVNPYLLDGTTRTVDLTVSGQTSMPSHGTINFLPNYSGTFLPIPGPVNFTVMDSSGNVLARTSAPLQVSSPTSAATCAGFWNINANGSIGTFSIPTTNNNSGFTATLLLGGGPESISGACSNGTISFYRSNSDQSYTGTYSASSMSGTFTFGGRVYQWSATPTPVPPLVQTSPTVSISADSTNIQVGQSTTIRGNYTAATGDPILQTTINIGATSVIPYSTDLQRTYTFTPTAAGDVAFLAYARTTSNPNWTVYATVPVHVAAAPTPSTPPAIPLNLASSCSTDGLHVTFNWSPGAGDTSYLLRLNDPANDGPSCRDSWWCANTTDAGPDTNGATSYTLPILPNHSYQWWLVGYNNAGNSLSPTAVGNVFTCSTPTPAPTSGTNSRYDFGGMVGYVNGTLVVNPATGSANCPSGYTPSTAYGIAGTDYPVSYCYRPHVAGVDPIYDFGGMTGYVNGTLVVNPATGAASCPSGYSSQQVLGTGGLDYPINVCYRPHVAGQNGFYDFGGMYGYGNGTNYPNNFYPNPTTGAASCPSGFTAVNILGTASLDWPLYFCYNTITSTPTASASNKNAQLASALTALEAVLNALIAQLQR